MPTQKFAIERGGAKRLTIWSGRHNPVRVFYDSCELVPEPIAGDDYRLPDGSVLTIVANENGSVDLFRQGKALPGSRLDPDHELAVAIGTLTLMAVAHFAIIPITEIQRSLPNWPITGISYSLGLAYGLAALGLRYRLGFALYLGMVLAFLEGVSATTLYLMLEKHPRLWKVALVFFIPLACLLPGIHALRQLSEAEEHHQ
jgi:hypothetical protein